MLVKKRRPKDGVLAQKPDVIVISGVGEEYIKCPESG